MWVDPLGLSCRTQNMGKTPSKYGKVGRSVIDRMRSEGRIRGDGYRDIRFKSSDGNWYHIKDADMSHLENAVTYWNRRGGHFGPKSKEVRSWMKDPKNYELEYYVPNRSRGGSSIGRYKKPGDFIGPAEKPDY